MQRMGAEPINCIYVLLLFFIFENTNADVEAKCERFFMVLSDSVHGSIPLAAKGMDNIVRANSSQHEKCGKLRLKTGCFTCQFKQF